MTTPDPPPPSDGTDATPTPDPAPTPAPSSGGDGVRDLATEMQKPALPFDPCTLRKGQVTALANTADPPTISVQISGDTTETIDAVRYLDSYSPVVGDTAIILKQGTDIVALGQIAAGNSGAPSTGGWTQATLASGFTHNGNTGGNVSYRKVMDNGAWKVQWQGIAARSSGTTIVSSLPAEFRPTVLRSFIAARDEGGGSNSVKIDFTPGGAVTMIGPTTAPASHTHTGAAHTHPIGNHTHDIGITHIQNVGGTTFTVAGGTNHQHFMDHWHDEDPTTVAGASVSDGSPTGSDGAVATTSNAGTVTAPTWLSFNGIEYFL